MGGWDNIEWLGNLEQCDLCHDDYPMAWIQYSGKQFLCFSCRHDILHEQIDKQDEQRN